MRGLTALYPHHCFLCGEVLLPRQRLCAACRERAPYVLPPVCELCGRGKERCRCEGRRHAYERCITPFYHTDRAKQGIATLKQEGYGVTVEGFAAEIAEVVRREYGGLPFTLVTSVPLHPKDRRRRGFDQSALLGQALAARLELPYLPVLAKVFTTRPQKELSALERSGNLLGVFEVTRPRLIEDKTVLLVDDVVTTGATLDECAKMLKIYGAVEVYAVTAAGAVMDGEKPEGEHTPCK